jgi:hypothetical protein
VEEEYGRARYPAYCNGWLYVLAPALAAKIAVAATATPFHFVDDIYVTGNVRKMVPELVFDFLSNT